MEHFPCPFYSNSKKKNNKACCCTDAHSRILCLGTLDKGLTALTISLLYISVWSKSKTLQRATEWFYVFF